MTPTDSPPPADLATPEPEKPPVQPGMSLGDYQDLFETEPPDDSTVADESGHETPGEVAEGEEPLHDLPADGDEPAEAEKSDETPDAESDEEGADADEVEDLVGETSKRGWPKPDYKPEDLDDNEVAQKVEKHWKRVFGVSRQEFAEYRKQYDGVDPEKAQINQQAIDELREKPEYALARAFIWKDADHPEVVKEYMPFAEALIRRDHPHHVEAIRRWQAGGAPGSPSGNGQSFRDPIEDAYDPETGELDRDKYLQAQRDRDLRLAQAVAQKLQARMPQGSKPPAEKDAAPPEPNHLALFCEANDLDLEGVMPAFRKAYRAARIDGEEPINSMEWAKKLWKRVQDMRETDLGPERRARQAEVARHKSASTARPRTAKPEAVGPNVTGMMLSDFLDLESTGQI